MKLNRPVDKKWPISSGYGYRKDPITGEQQLHAGIDFAVPIGTPVIAVLDGVIERDGWENAKNPKQGFGFRLWQKAQMGAHDVYVVYPHLNEQFVREGAKVKAGDKVALSGNTGHTSGPHIHFEVRVGGISGVTGAPIELIGE